MEQLASLKTKRGMLKKRLTHFSKFLREFKEGDCKFQLKTRIPVVEQIYKEFGAIQDQIDLLDDDEAHFTYRCEIDDQYCSLLSGLTKLLDNSQIIHQNVQASTSSEQQIHVRLPTLNLPEFNGSYTDWQTFFDTFKSLINDNLSLSDAQRFHYLRSCLKGEALRAVESLPISVANYNAALDILKKRYDNKRLIVQEHVRKILNCPSITKSTSTNLKQLIDIIVSNLEALKILQQPVDNWDALLIPLILEKLDFATIKEWQAKLNSELPTLDQFLKFLEARCLFLESLYSEFKTNNSKNQNVAPKPKPKQVFNSYVATTKPACLSCNKNNHFLYQCNQFLKLTIPDRIKKVQNLNLCKNCLRNNHNIKDCKSKMKCRECNLQHNTLLHEAIQLDKQASEDSSNSANSLHGTLINQSQVLLSTAIVQIKDACGKFHDCRALLDVGSQSNFLSGSMCEKLNIPKIQTAYQILGLNQTAIVDNITSKLPQRNISMDAIKIPKNIVLADPEFYISKDVDLLIGAEKFWELLCIGQLRVDPSQLCFQKTHLGWIAGGHIKHGISNNPSRCNIAINTQLSNQMARFWEIENIETTKVSGFYDHICEEQFLKFVKRDIDGRFIVPLLCKTNIINVGYSRHLAEKRFKYLEQKFNKNLTLKQNYVQFMNEYLDLGHMGLDITENEENNQSYYLPHHAVYKESNANSKFRVVFDASSKGSNGLSLNDNLLAGPTQQEELFSILLRFRVHRFAFTADISKMYRQIKIAPEFLNYQKILWRNDHTEPLKTYKLTTVTYGTSCAPYLAVRCLNQLAFENPQNNVASSVIVRDFYMDDLLTGCDSLEDAILLRENITGILAQGGFQLCKFAATHKDILPINDEENPSSPLINFDKDGFTKTLGLIWNCHNDKFSYNIQLKPESLKPTKRSILSTISKIFDPLGFLSPVIIISKRSIKAYIALFICLVTKAVHLELVGDLTTDSFLNALRRVVSRRGTVTHLLSDNATNFVGAKAQLNELAKFIKNTEFNNKVIKILELKGIQWSFIPPRSPNFGGIWEANIKSMKTHLRRVVGNALLNYEELYTVLTRIEACLNSRPITPLSNDPRDLQALTPGHFLIGDALTSPIEPGLQDLPSNRLSRWQLIEQLRQHFWRRWSREYISQLQGRTKWYTEVPPIKPGTLVILIEDNMPPLHWPLGRVDQLHPGADGLVRVVSVKTNKGFFKRSLNKLCILPIDNHRSEVCANSNKPSV